MDARTRQGRVHAVMSGAEESGVVDVRPADPSDASFITGLAERLAAVSRLPWLPAAATDRFAARGCEEAVAAIGQPRHVVLIAVNGSGRRLGFGHAHMDQSVFTSERVGYVSNVVVPAPAAGAGVGRRLMQSAEEWARRQGCGLMTLEVFGQNARPEPCTRSSATGSKQLSWPSHCEHQRDTLATNRPAEHQGRQCPSPRQPCRSAAMTRCCDAGLMSGCDV
jgi:GNAT superfamily N-acetyltransferase